MAERTADFESRVVSIFKALKSNTPCASSPVLPIERDGLVIGCLRVISRKTLQDPVAVRLLAAWRKKHSRWFPSQFRVTVSGTRRWATRQLLDLPDRILFFVEDLSGVRIGHVGLYRIDAAGRSCEIDNIVRGRPVMPGIMASAVQTLTTWAFSQLRFTSLSLRVLGHNNRAIRLYASCGFREGERIPLRRVVKKGSVSWEEDSIANSYRRFFLKMEMVTNDVKTG